MTDILDTLDDIEDEDLENDESDDNAEGDGESADEIDGTEDVDALEGEISDESSEAREFGEFSESKAREVTEAIKYAATATYALLYEAYSHKAHKALGYKTWASYVQDEFEMSKSRSYQLIAQAETIKSIEEIVPDGTDIKLTEAQVRDLKSELPRITEVIKQETTDMSPEEAEDFVNDLIRREREQAQADQKAIEAKRKAEQQAEQEGYQNALEDAADQMLEDGDGGRSGAYEEGGVVMEPDMPNDFGDNADSGFFEHEVEGNAGAMSSENALNVYNFFNALSSLTSLPEPEYIIDLISEDRKDEVDNQIEESAAWVNRFLTIWSEKH